MEAGTRVTCTLSGMDEEMAHPRTGSQALGAQLGLLTREPKCVPVEWLGLLTGWWLDSKMNYIQIMNYKRPRKTWEAFSDPTWNYSNIMYTE